MPRPAILTREHVAEIARRRRAGEPWKVIQRDFRARGLPAGRARLSEVWAMARRGRIIGHLGACSCGGDQPTPSG